MTGTWYYAQDNRTFGPFSWEQMQELASAGKLRRQNVVWQQGMTEGLVASAVNKLFPKARRVAAPDGL